MLQIIARKALDVGSYELVSLIGSGRDALAKLLQSHESLMIMIDKTPAK